MSSPATRDKANRLPQGIKLTELALDNAMNWTAQGQISELPVGTIPRNLPLFGILARFRYGLDVTAAATAVNADAPLSIAQSIRLTGDSKILGPGQEIWPSVSAADIDRYNQQTTGWRAFNVGQAIGSAVGTYDVDASLFIPTSLPQARHPIDQAESLLNGPDWSALNLYVQWGGVTDLIEGGTATLSAYGSSTGTPQVTFTAIQARLGGGVALRPYFVSRKQILLGAPAGTGTRFQLYPNLPIGKAYADLSLKTYLPASGAGASSLTAQSLDDGTFVTRFYIGDSSKDFVKVDWTAEQAITENIYLSGRPHVPGAVIKNFLGPHGDPESAFPTQLYSALSKQLNLYADVQSGFTGHYISVLASYIQAAG